MRLRFLRFVLIFNIISLISLQVHGDCRDILSYLGLRSSNIESCYKQPPLSLMPGCQGAIAATVLTLGAASPFLLTCLNRQPFYTKDKVGGNYICRLGNVQTITLSRQTINKKHKYTIVSQVGRKKTATIKADNLCYIDNDAVACPKTLNNETSGKVKLSGGNKWEHFCLVRYKTGDKYLHSDSKHEDPLNVVCAYQMHDHDKDCSRPGRGKAILGIATPINGTDDLLNHQDFRSSPVSAWAEALVKSRVESCPYACITEGVPPPPPTFNSYIVEPSAPVVRPLCYLGDDDERCKDNELSNIAVCKGSTRQQCFKHLHSNFKAPVVPLHLPKGDTFVQLYHDFGIPNNHSHSDNKRTVNVQSDYNYTSGYQGNAIRAEVVYHATVFDYQPNQVCAYTVDSDSNQQIIGCVERPKPADTGLFIKTELGKKVHGADYNKVKICFVGSEDEKCQNNDKATIELSEYHKVGVETEGKFSSLSPFYEQERKTLLGVEFTAIIPDLDPDITKSVRSNGLGYYNVKPLVSRKLCAAGSWKLGNPDISNAELMALPSPVDTRDRTYCCNDKEDAKKCLISAKENCSHDPYAKLAICPGEYKGNYPGAKICAQIHGDWNIEQKEHDKLCVSLK